MERNEFAGRVKASGRKFNQKIARETGWDFDAYCARVPAEKAKTWRQIYQDAYVKYNDLSKSADRKFQNASNVYGNDPVAALGIDPEEAEAERAEWVRGAEADLEEAKKYEVDARKYKLGYLTPANVRSSCVIKYEDGRVDLI